MSGRLASECVREKYMEHAHIVLGSPDGSGTTPDPTSAYKVTVAVIVVNWNTPKLVLECLAALRRSDGIIWHLYLVDNASSDDSAEVFRLLGADVTFVQSPENGGWTGGNNLGIRRALQDGHNYMFLLNSDAQVFPDTLSRLLEQAQTLPTAILGPIQLSEDQQFYNFAEVGIIAATGLPEYPNMIALDSPSATAIKELQPTAYVRGSGMLVSRAQIEQLGLFDDRYYLNYDDTDFCARARAAGMPVLMVKAARLIHATSGSIGGQESPLNKYFMTRNALLFARFHSSHRQRVGNWIAIVRSGLSDTGQKGRLRRLATLLFGSDPRLKAFRRGVFDFLVGRFGDCPAAIRHIQAQAKAAETERRTI